MSSASDRRLELPANTAAAGVVLDRAQVEAGRSMLAICGSADAKRLLGAWLAMPEFEFVVVCGQPYAASGAVYGGLARTQDDALLLLESAIVRLNEAATRGAGFTSAWVLGVDQGRRRAFEQVVARLQRTAGAA